MTAHVVLHGAHKAQVTLGNGESVMIREPMILTERRGRHWVRVLQGLLDVQFGGVAVLARTYAVTYVLQVIGLIERLIDLTRGVGIRLSMGWKGVQLEVVRKGI